MWEVMIDLHQRGLRRSLLQEVLIRQIIERLNPNYADNNLEWTHASIITSPWSLKPVQQVIDNYLLEQMESIERQNTKWYVLNARIDDPIFIRLDGIRVFIIGNFSHVEELHQILMEKIQDFADIRIVNRLALISIDHFEGGIELSRLNLRERDCLDLFIWPVGVEIISEGSRVQLIRSAGDTMLALFNLNREIDVMVWNELEKAILTRLFFSATNDLEEWFDLADWEQIQS